ncbi:MAG: IPT/TIG domain-containing protein [Chloroflexota bacterium]|nr:IPT/TIG domain-containing protein [Chloroflexota bacterium]
MASVPDSAATGPVTVSVNSVPSNSNRVFVVPHPAISSIAPSTGAIGGTITITGSDFGATNDGSAQVTFSGTHASYSSWSDTSIAATVPTGATSGPVTVTRYGVTSNDQPFTLIGQPTISGISPASGPAGTVVTITGTNFGPSQSNSTVDFNGVVVTPVSWSDTQIVVAAPDGVFTGPIEVTVAALTAASTPFIVNSTVQITDSRSNQTTYNFDMLGGVWQTTDVSGPGCSTCTMRRTAQNTYDSKGNLLSGTDALGRTNNYTYDSNNNLTSESVQVGTTTATTSYAYNSFGEALTVTDPLGQTTTNAYDSHGNLLSITSPAPDGSTSASVTHFAYDAQGQLTQITDPLGQITTLAYTSAGLIATITDPQQNATSYEYDARGNRTAVVDAMQHRTTFTYDLGNRLTGISYPDSTSVSFGYDSRGRRTSVTDQNGKTTTYAYDDADRLTSVTDAAQHTTQYAYDTENNLVSITDAKGRATSFAYDANGWVTGTTFPSGLAEVYAYDAVGNLTTKTDRKGQTIQFVYDALDRLTHKGYPDSTGVDYVYDLVGKIQQVTDPTGTYGFAYDNMGRLIGTTTQHAFLPGRTITNSYSYDAASNRTSATLEGTTNSYQYDTLNRLTDLTNSFAGHFTFAYDALSRRTSFNRPNGINTAYTYDSLSRLMSVLHKLGGATIDGAGYGLDSAGNRTSKSNYIDGSAESYAYDAVYQLTQVTKNGGLSESYTYDEVGNRLSSLGVPSYTVNNSNQLTSTSAATFTYDNDGNTTSKADTSGTTTYAWDFENRLVQVLPAGGTLVTFKYDPFGRRIQKASSAGTVIFVYDGANIVEELNGGGAVTAQYAQGSGIDEPLAANLGGTLAYYEADGLGSITSLTDNAGSAVAAYTRDAFGKSLSTADTLGNRFRYTGREWEEETGLYYYRARYYDSTVGRFVSEDPIRFGGGRNFYTYVKNTSPNITDPLGLKGCDSCKYAPPMFSDNPACNDYGNETYDGVSLKCFCKCAGDSPWALQVRGCLACEHKKGTSTTVAHAKCYAWAGLYDMPYDVVKNCLQKCCVGLGCKTWTHLP